MEVSFMEPSSKVNQIVLRQWDMLKESGKKSSCYVMIKAWNEVVQKNDLGRKLNQIGIYCKGVNSYWRLYWFYQ
ncbi:hypothetical protein SO802_026245 [Lithocarpus litseifolius]|uniref:Uncharacterized protein n=1 Tax=Lithocarpus litseifolius TaxID=425828 RepID=A0AAW2C4D9_9ROSI